MEEKTEAMPDVATKVKSEPGPEPASPVSTSFSGDVEVEPTVVALADVDKATQLHEKLKSRRFRDGYNSIKSEIHAFESREGEPKETFERIANFHANKGLVTFVQDSDPDSDPNLDSCGDTPSYLAQICRYCSRVFVYPRLKVYVLLVLVLLFGFMSWRPCKHFFKGVFFSDGTPDGASNLCKELVLEQSLSSLDPVELVELVAASVEKHTLTTQEATLVDAALILAAIPALVLDMHELRSTVLDTLETHSAVLLRSPCSSSAYFDELRCEDFRDTVCHGITPLTVQVKDVWFRVRHLESQIMQLVFYIHLASGSERVRLVGLLPVLMQVQGMDKCLLQAELAVIRLKAILTSVGNDLCADLITALYANPSFTVNEVDERVLCAIGVLDCVRTLWAGSSKDIQPGKQSILRDERSLSHPTLYPAHP